jgi:hypothetical protein
LAACASRPVLPTTGPYAIKIESFPEADQKLLRSVFDAPTAMVALPETRVASRTDIYEFLLGNLPFTAGVLRAQGRAVYKIWREPGDAPDEVRFDDTKGIQLTARLLRREPGRWTYFSKGTYNLGLFTVPGRTAIIVVYEEREGALWTQARVYAKVEGVVLEQGARLFQLVEGAIRKRGFVFIDAACSVAEMAAAEPERILRESGGSPEVDPAALEEFRRRFIR